MKIIAIDSSGLVAGVAVLEDETLLAEFTTNYKKTHSQTLIPMLDAVKNMIDLDLEEVDAIAISAGPGSFTGLRIGSATAKGLGLALAKPLVEVSTLEGLAMNLYGVSGYVCPLMDARRNQVYTALYRFVETGENYTLETVIEPCAIDVVEMIEKINSLSTEVTFLGDGVPVYHSQIAEKCKVNYHLAPAHMNRQKASSVAVRAMELAKQGIFVEAQAHEPEYLRKSQAEREREENEKNS